MRGTGIDWQAGTCTFSLGTFNLELGAGSSGTLRGGTRHLGREGNRETLTAITTYIL